jgi:hypothetical protein
VTVTAEDEFLYPIGILLFNSPDYSEIVLRSLLSQDIKVDPSRVVITVDGYIGSKDESAGKNNQVDQVIAIAKRFFPDSKIVQNITNQGIAKQFQFLERELFNFPNSEWALFLEHDFELFPNYLRGIDTLMKATNQFDEIVQVDCTGDTHMRLSRGVNSVYPTKHHWAFALKKSHYLERNFIVSEYVESISTSYHLRDWQKVNHVLQRHGVYPFVSDQDSVNRAIMHKMGKLAVTSGLHLGRYIGAEGEHFTPELFAKLGYENWDSYSGAEFHIEPHEVEKILTVLNHEELLSVLKTASSMYEFWFNLMSELNAKVVNLHNECTKLNGDIENLKNSKSWRITAPFRGINLSIGSVLSKFRLFR